MFLTTNSEAYKLHVVTWKVVVWVKITGGAGINKVLFYVVCQQLDKPHFGGLYMEGLALSYVGVMTINYRKCIHELDYVFNTCISF